MAGLRQRYDQGATADLGDHATEFSDHVVRRAHPRTMGRQAPISLEKPVGDEEQSEFGRFIADEGADSPYERAVEILTNEALREALENLSYRERRVLELRYGLGGEHPQALQEVGREFNVTRERIRQIENQSLKKLQNLAEVQKLRDDVEIASGFALRRR